MPLEIQSLADVKVSNLKVLLYGPPGVGKSTLAFSSDRCLALDFDRGSYRTPNAPEGLFVTDWRRQLGRFRPEDLAPYKTLVIDTVGTALDLLMVDILHENARLRQPNGAPHRNAYGLLLTRFGEFLSMCVNSGVDVVMVAHAVEQEDGGQLVQRIRVTGQTKDNVLQMSDLIGRLWIENGERRLSFDPKFASHGKNMGLPDMVLPPTAKRPSLMSELLMDAKRHANSRNPEGVLYYRIIDATREPDDLLDALNDLIQKESRPPREWSAECQRLLYARAKDGGLSFDRTTGLFVESVVASELATAAPVPQAAPPPPAEPEREESSKPAPHPPPLPQHSPDPDLYGPADEDEEEFLPFEPPAEPEREPAMAGAGASVNTGLF